VLVVFDLHALDAVPLDRLRAICPRCRRLLPVGGTCQLDGQPALELRNVVERDSMVEAIWGSLEHREQLRQSVAQRAGAQRVRGGLIAFASTFALGCAIQADIVLGLITGVLGGAVGFSVGAARSRVMIPIDASPLPQWNSVGHGTIVGAREILAPGSRARCAAWSIELRYQGSWGKRTTLRAGGSAGFDIRLDGGEHVRIPAGALWLDDRLAQVDGDDAIVDDLVHLVDPHGLRSSWPLFPFNIIVEQVLLPDDRVEVLGPVEPRPIADDSTRLYRDAAPTMLFHTTLPVLRAGRS
jgi:tetrahydromethanopterin S-methyltransferase subunit B